MNQACILCDTTKNVEKRFILPRHRDESEGATAKPICERCYDQYNWKPSNVSRRKSQEKRGSGNPPGYGYRTVNGRIIPIPEQVETIERVIELRHDGWSWNAIAYILNREGRPTAKGGDWYPQTVINIYRREFPGHPMCSSYPSRYGYTTVNGQIVPHEREQSVLRFMQDLRDEGASFTSIAETLNRHRVPSKRGSIWYSASVSTILRREGVS